MVKSAKEYKEQYQEIFKLYETGNYKLKELSKIFNIRYDTISTNLRKNGYKTNPHGKFPIKSDIFSSIDTEEKAYWLGFLYSDGYVSKRDNSIELGLKLSDYEHLEKFINFIGWKGTVKKDSYRCRVIFADKQIKEDLIKLGCTPVKSLTLKFPTEEQVPKKFIKHFIRGYFDGDGSIYYSKNKNTTNCGLALIGTKEFLNETIKRLNLPNRNFRKRSDWKDNTFYFSFSGNYCNQILDFMYKDSNIYLNRKYQLYKEIKMKIENKEILDYEKVNSKSNANLNKINFYD